MGTFLLLLFIFFIVIPVCRVLWRGWQLHRQWRRATQGMRDAFDQARAQAAGRSQPQNEPRRKKKKIDPNVGEYVAFEEVSTTTTTETKTSADGRNTTHVRTESQVEDAVWEDL